MLRFVTPLGFPAFSVKSRAPGIINNIDGQDSVVKFPLILLMEYLYYLSSLSISYII